MMNDIRLEHSYCKGEDFEKSYFNRLKLDQSFASKENILALLEVKHKNDKGEYEKVEAYVLVKGRIFKITYEIQSKNALRKDGIKCHSEVVKLSDIKSVKENCQYYKGTQGQDEILKYGADIELANDYKFIQFKEDVLCDKSSRESVSNFIEAIKAQF